MELAYSESVCGRVVYMNEIYHLFTTKIDRGGSRTISHEWDKDERKGRRGTRGSWHTTGVYTINACGEVLPPLHIFDIFAKTSSNCQFQS